jgi:hypothetical protein
MTRAELATEIELLRPIITNIIGFHDLAEQEDVPLTPLQRVIYGAHVYAAGVELADRLCRLIHAMNEDR